MIHGDLISFNTKEEISHVHSKDTAQTSNMSTNHSSDEDKIKQIVERRLVRAPLAVKEFLPPILSDPKFWLATVREKAYLLVAFLSEKDRKRIQDLTAQGYHPFPGLIASTPEIKAALGFENARNILIEDNKIGDIYTLSLGKDVTAILVNHTQSVKTKEFGKYEYKIPLAYLVAYGDEINRATWDYYLENLIAYSIIVWRSGHAG